MAGGKLSSRALLDYYIKRIEHLNPQLNAVVATDYSAARARPMPRTRRAQRVKAGVCCMVCR
ncbi:MAG: hypothetical protein ABF318_02445 [Ketobacter sp.]